MNGRQTGCGSLAWSRKKNHLFVERRRRRTGKLNRATGQNRGEDAANELLGGSSGGRGLHVLVGCGNSRSIGGKRGERRRRMESRRWL